MTDRIRSKDGKPVHPTMILTVMAFSYLLSCSSVPIQRQGAPETQIVSRSYPVDLESFRAAILLRFSKSSNSSPPPFDSMRVRELNPPNYPADWLITLADPGGFLEPYKRLPGSLRARDLLIEEPIGDLYWPSEYSTTAGPVRFRCGFILHFSQPTPSTTEVQVYEKVPEIWPGEHWALLHEGIGVGKVHDIRFVEPTVKDRMDMLNLLRDLVDKKETT